MAKCNGEKYNIQFMFANTSKELCRLFYKLFGKKIECNLKNTENFRENGRFFRQNDVFLEVRGSAKLTERSGSVVH